MSVPVFMHVQIAPALSGLLFVLFGKLLAVWDCICSSPSVQRHANEFVNSTEQLIKLFFNCSALLWALQGDMKDAPVGSLSVTLSSSGCLPKPTVLGCGVTRSD